MTEPERRQRRPAVSCSLCRKRKVRCNRETPCSNCVRSRNENCVYENQPSQPPQQHHLGNNDRKTSELSLASSASALTPVSQTSAQDVESMKSRIRELEEQLSNATQRSTQSPMSTSNSNIDTITSGIAGTFHFQHESRFFGQAEVVNRGIIHKTRLFGRSHWMNGATLLLENLEIIEPYIQDSSKASTGLHRCKSLARIIKLRRAPMWPSLPTPDLPPKEVSDKLINCYFRTSETVYRILHIPTFMKDYEALWADTNPSNIAFLVQLKLVLAIGATTYDQQFSLRTSAIQWIYEAQTWLSEPEFKSQLSIQTLQTKLLLLVARETVGIGANLTWISTGAIFRAAVYMGLHRDPEYLPKKTTFTAEIRRRLWNTILEITLQSSMSSGGPPFISLDDFDTEPPSNFDDEQLFIKDWDDAAVAAPEPKPENNFTEVSIAIALRKTFPLRLKIAKFLNNLDSHGTYDEALRLDTELRVSYKALCQTLQEFKSTTRRSPSPFEIGTVDFLISRYLSSLHIPFFGLALHETAYAFSRKVLVETALKIWYTAYPPTPPFMAAAQSRGGGGGQDDLLARLVACGSGFFRTVTMQACFVIAVEIRTQLQEEAGLGPVPLRPDLLSVLDDAKTWCLRCFEAGETNIKGYLFMCLATAHIKGLIQGLRKDEFPELLIKAVEEAEERCLPILEEMVVRTGGIEDGLDHQMSLNSLPQPMMMEDWDFMMPDAQFNFGDADIMGWVFNDETTQQPSLW